MRFPSVAASEPDTNAFVDELAAAQANRSLTEIVRQVRLPFSLRDSDSKDAMLPSAMVVRAYLEA